MNETELWEWMMDAKGRGGILRQAYATLTRNVTLSKWNGHGALPEFTECVVPGGSRVRVVMASRFGDVGITDNLNATSGYHYRSMCVEGELRGEPTRPAGLLSEIEKIEH